MYQIIGFARASFTLCHLSPSCLLWNIVKYVVIPLSVPRDCVIRLALIMSHDKSTFILMLLYILQKGTLYIFLARGGNATAASAFNAMFISSPNWALLTFNEMELESEGEQIFSLLNPR